jgi:hypothetical protein
LIAEKWVSRASLLGSGADGKDQVRCSRVVAVHNRDEEKKMDYQVEFPAVGASHCCTKVG